MPRVPIGAVPLAPQSPKSFFRSVIIKAARCFAKDWACGARKGRGKSAPVGFHVNFRVLVGPPRLGPFLWLLHSSPRKAPRDHCLGEVLTQAEWTRPRPCGDAFFPVSPREASRFENQFSFGRNRARPTVMFQSGIEPGP